MVAILLSEVLTLILTAESLKYAYRFYYGTHSQPVKENQRELTFGCITLGPMSNRVDESLLVQSHFYDCCVSCLTAECYYATLIVSTTIRTIKTSN